MHAHVYTHTMPEDSPGAVGCLVALIGPPRPFAPEEAASALPPEEPVPIRLVFPAPPSSSRCSFRGTSCFRTQLLLNKWFIFLLASHRGKVNRDNKKNPNTTMSRLCTPPTRRHLQTSFLCTCSFVKTKVRIAPLGALHPLFSLSKTHPKHLRQVDF